MLSTSASITALRKREWVIKVTTYEVLHQPFDLEVHKKTFQHYLEVIIDEVGTVHYAVPSHQEWLIQKARKMQSVTREQLYDLCPPEYYFDVIGWLTQTTKCIAVWDESYVGNPNEQQLRTLNILEENHLFTHKGGGYRKNEC